VGVGEGTLRKKVGSTRSRKKKGRYGSSCCEPDASSGFRSSRNRPGNGRERRSSLGDALVWGSQSDVGNVRRKKSLIENLTQRSRTGFSEWTKVGKNEEWEQLEEREKVPDGNVEATDVVGKG